jgi:hypothetical protein
MSIGRDRNLAENLGRVDFLGIHALPAPVGRKGYSPPGILAEFQRGGIEKGYEPESGLDHWSVGNRPGRQRHQICSHASAGEALPMFEKVGVDFSARRVLTPEEGEKAASGVIRRRAQRGGRDRLVSRIGRGSERSPNFGRLFECEGCQLVLNQHDPNVVVVQLTEQLLQFADMADLELANVAEHGPEQFERVPQSFRRNP